ncbi:NACHT domain-containing protein [Streptomyces sp. S465]|uniref:NACHT domain-containing protein n=1 Tax=Streptomyces sp. S465 TaxID=2979468 RepID=UPI0022A8C363|nr:NACHT domain-containing protein [Streptomyces sp. S465]WAP56828.1 NACHT domain-containing protein [Streptomyces sp. S465]
MDPAAATAATDALVQELFVADGPVDRPVRLASLVAFQGDHRTLTERDLPRIAAALAEAELRRTARPGVIGALARTLHSLGTIDLDDVRAVRLGPEAFARHLAVAAPDAGEGLDPDEARLHASLREAVAAHILRFLTLRSRFVAAAEDAAFEERYAQDIVAAHDHLTIYGIDLAHSPDSWPLDAAYLSLETETDGGSPSAPAEQALAGRERVLLWGVAGAGKTTLVQRLAVSVARGDLPAPLEGLRGRVPFVLPVRRFRHDGNGNSNSHRNGFPEPDAFLSAVRYPHAAAQPPGWAERVLSDGRGLLLVDGVDEAPEQARERLREALRELPARYPGNVWLVTSRPSAVRENWLASERFTELKLSPLSRDGVTAFIRRWHEAARQDITDRADLDRLSGYEETLLDAVRITRELGRLATNPLMCGLLCALHRDRRGYLPRGRKALYDAALSMLLERRDRERAMLPPDGIDLTQEPKIQLLQKLAHWMLVNGRSEMDRATAVETLGRHLPAIPHAARQGGPEEIYRHLLNRTGLLREPTPGSVDFVHRTFQDYLSARAVVERHDFDFLIDHAHLDDWEEVIRMSVALARPDECGYLLEGLLAARKDARPVHARHRKLLAAACLEHATELDPEVRSRVHRYTRDLVRPTSLEAARALGWIGPIVLEMLPDPSGVSDEEAHRLAVTATSIADDRAIDYLVRLRDRASWAVRAQLAGAWRRYDTDRYADEIIAHLDARELDFPVSDLEELRALRRLGGRPCVQIAGAFTPEQLTEGLVAERLTELWLAYDLGEDLDLSWLAAFPQLHTLRLSHRNAEVTGVPEGVQVIVTGA